VVGIAASIGLASKGAAVTGDADATFELCRCDSSICTLSVVSQLGRPGSTGPEADGILMREDGGLLLDGPR
jgi:hypothetical protein